MNDLRDKVVLITGASTGIGAGVARAFAGAGSKLVIHYNESQEAAEAVAAEIRAVGAKVAVVRGDLGDATTVARVAAEGLDAFGRIDVLINNAGGMLGRIRIEDYTDAHIAKVVALNVTQVALMMREIVPIMKRQKGGNVINVTSIAVHSGGGNGATLYAGAKGFISTTTRGWARELVNDRIRVNAVSPGVIATRFHDRYTTPEQLKTIQATVPMNRIGMPDDCTGAFLYLASDRLSSYLTGQTIEVNGGQYMAS